MGRGAQRARGGAQERRLLELARFELLTPAEQRIYLNNGGLAVEEQATRCRPCGRGSALAAVIMLFLVVIPTLFLLLFGVSMGKKMVKVWWIGTMTAFTAVEAAIYQPLIIMFLHVYLPFLVRKKLKRSSTRRRSRASLFATPLYE